MFTVNRCLVTVLLLLVSSITYAQPPNGPASCDPGTYYDSTIFACRLCPKGQYCLGGVGSAAVGQFCASGFYAEPGSSSCSPCPAGTMASFSTVGGFEVCENCPAGTYQPYTNVTRSGSGWNDVYYGTGGADNKCIPCPLGTYSLGDGVASCDGLLPANIKHMYVPNSYKVKGDTSPLGFLNKNESCWAGWHCGLGTDRYKCPIGTYAYEGDGVCSICPKGAICNEVGQIRPKFNMCSGRANQAGTFYMSYQDMEGVNSTAYCKYCTGSKSTGDLEYYAADISPELSPRPIMDDVSKCLYPCSGYQVYDGSTCAVCPSGSAKLHRYYNPNGNGLYSDYNATCVTSCPPGTRLITSSGNSACVPCETSGSYCPGGLVSNNPVSVSCPSITITGGGVVTSKPGAEAKSANDCTITCSNNQHCYVEGTTVCGNPPPGYKSTGSGGKCVPCGVNIITEGYLPGNTGCTYVNAGQYILPNRSIVNCENGNYCPYEAPYNKSIPCPAGYDSLNATVSSWSSPTISAFSVCVPRVCPPRSYFHSDTVSCKSCFDNATLSYRFPCPGGSRDSSAVNNPQVCGFGQRVSPDGTSCITDTCAPGFYWISYTFYNGTGCRSCNWDTNATWIVCPGGANYNAARKICHPQAPSMSDRGVVNLERTACVAAATTCTAGKYLSNGLCLSCPSNQYCTGGTTQPQSCTGNQVVNAVTKASCITPVSSCVAGEYLDNQQCFVCPVGSYCTGGTANAVVCPTGFTTAANRSTASSDCSVVYCNAGYYRSSSNTCVVCNSGSYSPGGTVSSCTACPNNGTTTVASPASINDCLPGPTTTVTLSMISISGTSTMDNSAQSSSACSTSCNNDVNCIAWSYDSSCSKFGSTWYGLTFMDTSTTGVLTGRITSSSILGMVNGAIGTKTTCNAGYALANGICYSCATINGKVCLGNATAPTACTSGMIPNADRSACITPATSCPAGKMLSQGVCNDCPMGNYICPGGTSSHISCTSPLVSDAARTTCVSVAPCPPGQYAMSTYGCRYCGLYTNLENYPYGEFKKPATSYYYFCPGGSAQSYSPPRCTNPLVPSINQTTCVSGCAMGKYLAGGTAITDVDGNVFLDGGVCTDCPIGKACYGGLSPAVSCPAMTAGGFSWTTEYSGTGSRRCIPTGCPAGYYINNATSLSLNFYDQANYCMRCPPQFTCPGGMGSAASVYAYGATCAPGTYLAPGPDCAYWVSQPVCAFQPVNPVPAAGTCASCPPGAYVCPGGGALPDYCDQSKGYSLAVPNQCTKANSGGGGGGGGGCTGNPPPCTAPSAPMCVSSSWQCISPPTCTGDRGDCNGNFACITSGPYSCTVFPSCTAGTYIEYFTPTVDTVCHSPPIGSSSCPAGQYLKVTGTSVANLNFSCLPCPSGFTCTGGVGAVAISVAEYPIGSAAPCSLAAGESVTVSEIQAGSTNTLKHRCVRRSILPSFASQVRLSCSPGTYTAGLYCYPCPVGASQCQGMFHLFNIGSGGTPPAPSASSTPSNTPSPSSSASSAPPPEQAVLVPYLLSSPDVCASEEVANKFLDPTTGIAINLRYSMASSLGYNGSSAFVSGLMVCDGTYIPVDKSASINTVNADKPFNGTVESSSSITNRRRRLYDMLNKLNLPIDGQTVVVELGVAVPAILAPALTNLMVALMTNQSAADIQALAANLTSLMASPEYLAMYPVQSGPNTAAGLPASLTAVINTAANAGNVPSFTASLGGVMNAAITPLLDALNITSANITTKLFSDGIRGGETFSYAGNNGNNNGGAAAPSGDSGSSGGNGALGALVLIPIAILVVFGIVWYRRRKTNEKGDQKGKSLDNNFTDVATTANIDLDTSDHDDKNIKVDFSPTAANESFEGENPLRVNNPLPSAGLTIRRTVVAVNTASTEPNSTLNASSV